MIDEEPEGAIHLHIKHHSALSLLLPYWLRQRTGELWIQPDAAADLNRHGFALKSLQWCPLEETGERILVQFPAVDNICVARPKTFDNLSLPVCSINGAFSIFQVIHTCVQKMTATFSPNCPFACVTTWATWWGPSLGKCPTDVRDTAKVADGQHAERTDQGMCFWRSCKCLCAHEYRIDGFQFVYCLFIYLFSKSPSVSTESPWKWVPVGKTPGSHNFREMEILVSTS